MPFGADLPRFAGHATATAIGLVAQGIDTDSLAFGAATETDNAALTLGTDFTSGANGVAVAAVVRVVLGVGASVRAFRRAADAVGTALPL